MKQTILWLRLEGLVILVLAVIGYQQLEVSWWPFVVLLLAPDISMVGYLLNTKVGAVVYNFGHSLVLPLLILAAGWLRDANLLLGGGFIWIAHIGLDRALGYGLKEPAGFKHTHLGKIG